MTISKADTSESVAAENSGKTNFVYEKGRIYEISLNELKIDNKSQPRKYFDPEELKHLKQSISDQGLIYPIIFRVDEKLKLVLVSGERRVKACKDLKMETIPGIYNDSDKYDEIALVDNVQRVGLHPVEEADAVQNLKIKYNYTLVQIGNLIGKAHNTVSDILTLTRLPAEIREDALKHKKLSRSGLLKVARMEKVSSQRKAYESLKNAVEEQGKKEKSKRRPIHIRAIDTTDRTIKLIQDINLDNLGNGRADLVTKLRELKTEIDKILSISVS